VLPGIEIKPLRFADERGFFSEIMRSDWTDVFQDDLCQANISISYPGVVRAWHKHERAQVDRFLVIKRSLKICAHDGETQELDEVVSTGDNLQVVRVPGHYWHGFKVVGNDPATRVYFVNKLYDYKDPDEIRRSWNDPSIVPRSINGIEDERCGRQWDWLHPPFK
jgi:dTDP-4-dehydrorhamnose 3,5-epimerase